MGHNDKSTQALEKVMLEYLRCILKVKMTTSKCITISECGLIPPIILAQINVIIFFIRVKCMSDDSILKKIFLNSQDLHEMGFKTWYGKVCDLAMRYEIDIKQLPFSEQDHTGKNIGRGERSTGSQF